MIETLDELTEHLADLLGIYRDSRCGPEEHKPECDCRQFWVAAMADRIRAAILNEGLLVRHVTHGNAGI